MDRPYAHGRAPRRQNRSRHGLRPHSGPGKLPRPHSSDQHGADTNWSRTSRGRQHRSAAALLSTCPHQHQHQHGKGRSAQFAALPTSSPNAQRAAAPKRHRPTIHVPAPARKNTALNPTPSPHTQRAAAPKRHRPTIHVSAQPEAQSDVVAGTVLRLTSGLRALPAQGWERTRRTHQSRRLPRLGGALITIGSQGHNRQVRGGNCGRILSRHPNPTPPRAAVDAPACLSPETPSPASGTR